MKRQDFKGGEGASLEILSGLAEESCKAGFFFKFYLIFMVVSIRIREETSCLLLFL